MDSCMLSLSSNRPPMNLDGATDLKSVNEIAKHLQTYVYVVIQYPKSRGYPTCFYTNIEQLYVYLTA